MLGIYSINIGLISSQLKSSPKRVNLCTIQYAFVLLICLYIQHQPKHFRRFVTASIPRLLRRPYVCVRGNPIPSVSKLRGCLKNLWSPKIDHKNMEQLNLVTVYLMSNLELALVLHDRKAYIINLH